MSDILFELGIDPESVTWYDLAACRDMPKDMLNLFFDDYEESDVVAKQTDAMCLSCPVINQCLRAGITGEETGVWGGVYLTEGEVDGKMNRHKEDEDWDEWRRTIEH